MNRRCCRGKEEDYPQITQIKSLRTATSFGPRKGGNEPDGRLRQ